MGKRDNKKANLFERFAINLELLKLHPSVTVAPDTPNSYVCPLCWKLFPKEALQVLTLEHVPPQHFGGHIRLLTCQICNNSSGHLLDSHLARKEDLADAFETRTAIEAMFTLNQSIRIGGTFQFPKQGSIHLKVDKTSNPYRYPDLIRLFEQGLTPDIHISFKGYNQRNVKLAMVRIAYLLAVSELGYGFLCNDRIHAVRLQIQSPQKEIFSLLGILEYDFPDALLGINYVSYPAEEDAFLVVFEMNTTSRVKRYGVLLPGTDELYN